MGLVVAGCSLPLTNEGEDKEEEEGEEEEEEEDDEEEEEEEEEEEMEEGDIEVEVSKGSDCLFSQGQALPTVHSDTPSDCCEALASTLSLVVVFFKGRQPFPLQTEHWKGEWNSTLWPLFNLKSSFLRAISSSAAWRA